MNRNSKFPLVLLEELLLIRVVGHLLLYTCQAGAVMKRMFIFATGLLIFLLYVVECGRSGEESSWQRVIFIRVGSRNECPE